MTADHQQYALNAVGLHAATLCECTAQVNCSRVCRSLACIPFAGDLSAIVCSSVLDALAAGNSDASVCLVSDGSCLDLGTLSGTGSVLSVAADLKHWVLQGVTKRLLDFAGRL